MSTQSGPEDRGRDPGLSAVMSERRQLINLAYRLLGSLADAEDVVQETYARWYAMTPQQQQAIESPGGWLTTVASRICLDLLGSARARRERYVGEWIPEPLPAPAEWISGQAGGTSRPGRPGHPRRVDQHGLPGRARIDDPGRARRVHPSRCLPLLLRRSGRDRRPYAGGMSPAGLLGPPSHSRSRRLRRPRQPSRPTSSETSSRHGRPRTSRLSSASSTPTPQRSPTAAASPRRTSVRSKAASRSLAPTSISPARPPT